MVDLLLIFIHDDADDDDERQCLEFLIITDTLTFETRQLRNML